MQVSKGAHAAVALPAVRVLAPPSQVGRLGLVAKKGVVQGAIRSGTGGSTCSSSRASSASPLMLLRGAPAYNSPCQKESLR